MGSPSSARAAGWTSTVRAAGYVEDIPARSKVGDVQGKRLLAVLNLETGRSAWADGGFAGEKRGINWSMPRLSEGGAIAVADVRAGDNKDRWLVAVDPDSGSTRVIDALHDDAWVREIGGFGPSAQISFGWLPDNQHIWFLSERDGWMQLYTVNAIDEHATARQLTEGKWEIESLALSPDKKYFADRLKGALLICHGMVDTNVFFQDTVRLAQRLIELRKENWSLAVFPVENHGFEEETSWADEYRRILKLFEDNLRTAYMRDRT